ncbi:MAG: agmatinase [Candidatus Deianiraeaceae bacterium]|jgi:agmatinase
MLKFPFDILPSQEGFLGLESNASYENATVVVVPFGLESSVSYEGGTRHGPQATITASHQVELFDDELWCEPYKSFSICTMKEREITGNLNEEIDNIEAITQKILDDGKFPLTIGGEHSITIGAIKPFAKKYQDLTILHFDAHADLRQEYNNEPNSHACALRRCLDFPHISLVSYGIRNISAEEIPFLEDNSHRIKINWARNKKHWNLQEDLKWFEGKNIYITFDVDGFDSSVMPATGTPEPGGMFWDDVLPIIKEICKVGNVVGADINELAPRSNFHFCDFLTAKLAYKILSYKFVSGK